MSTAGKITILKSSVKNTDSDSEDSNMSIPCIVAAFESVEEVKSALRKELVPLPKEITEVLEESKKLFEKNGNVDPFLATNIEDYETISDEKQMKPITAAVELVNENIIVEKPNVETNLPLPNKPKSEGFPFAANDTLNIDYTSYNTDWMNAIVGSYEKVKVQTSTDSYGRNFYLFDDGTNVSLLIMVFDTPAGRMLCINDTILPLVEFLSINHVQYEVKPKEDTKPITELRRSYGPVNNTSVICKTVNCDKWFTIPNTTVNHIMTALLFLTKQEKVAKLPEGAGFCNDTSAAQQAHPGILRRFLSYIW